MFGNAFFAAPMGLLFVIAGLYARLCSRAEFSHPRIHAGLCGQSSAHRRRTLGRDWASVLKATLIQAGYLHQPVE